MSTIIFDLALHENVSSTIIVDMAVNVLVHYWDETRHLYTSEVIYCDTFKVPKVTSLTLFLKVNKTYFFKKAVFV